MVFAVGVDAKTVWEHRGEHVRSQQKDVADGQVALNLLLLKPEHQSVLFSIERLSVYKDIEVNQRVVLIRSNGLINGVSDFLRAVICLISVK